MAWKRIALPIMPWTTLFDEELARTGADLPNVLPDFQGADVWAFSDYSGHHKASDFTVMAVLLMDVDASPDWPRARAQIRSRFLSDGRRMSYKGLNDGQKRLALVPFLEAADLLDGLVAVIAVYKEVRHLCSGEETLSTYDATLRLQGKWNNKSFENMLRICHFVTLLIAGLTTQRDITWFTDQDEFVANDLRKADVAQIAAGVLSAYSAYTRRTIQFGTTALDEDDRGIEDLTAIPDLIAGATAEFVTHLWRDSNSMSSCTEFLTPLGIAKKTDDIMTWWGQTEGTLKRLLWVLTEETRNEVRGIRLRRLHSRNR